MNAMTKYLIFPFLIAAQSALAAGNPIFGENRNQLLLNIGQGFDSGELIAFKHLNKPAPFYMIALSYSQPESFFRMPARQSLSIVKTLGFGSKDYYGKCRHDRCEWKDYSSEIFMLSEDVAFLHAERWYFGAGMGFAMQGKRNMRMNTKFALGFKLFAGYRISDGWSLEVAMQHFSNGDTGEENNVYDFWGIGIAHNF
jgi:hypothetical protein